MCMHAYYVWMSVGVSVCTCVVCVCVFTCICIWMWMFVMVFVPNSELISLIGYSRLHAKDISASLYIGSEDYSIYYGP